MAKVAHLFVFFLYAVPFVAVLDGAYIFEWLVVAAILMAYACGAFSASALVAQREYIDRENYLVVAPWKLAAVVIFYLLVRYPLISNLLTQLMHGNYAHWAQSKAYARYSGDAIVGLRDKLASVLLVTYGFLLGAALVRRYWFYFAVYAVMIIVETSGLARSGVLLSLCAFLVEYVIRKNRTLGSISIYAYLPRALLAVVVLMAVFAFSAVMRVYNESDVFSIVAIKVSSYTIAIYQALLIWMQGQDQLWGGYGRDSFASIYKAFGYEVKQGFYDPVLTGFGYTNIFTSIRGVLSDFGLVGAGGFYFLIGLMVSFYSKVPLGRFAYIYLRFFLFFLFFPLYSPFIFTSVLVAFILSALIIYLPSPRGLGSHFR